MTSVADDLKKISKRFKEELQEFNVTINSFKLSMPLPAALEFQYALNHFFAARQKVDGAEQLKHLERACGRFQRSHLDWLKSHILKAQDHLAKDKPHYAAYFGHRQGELRQNELDTLGAPDRKELYNKYRILLTEILPYYLRGRENQKTEKSFTLAGLGKEEYVGQVTSQLYKEWVYLEARLAAFSGDRCYDHIMMVILGYLENQLNNILPRLIAILKLSLLQRLNQCYESKAKSEGMVPDVTSSSVDMFERSGNFNKTIITKWKICRDMTFDLSGQKSGDQNTKLNKLIEVIDDPFGGYSFLAKQFKLPAD